MAIHERSAVARTVPNLRYAQLANNGNPEPTKRNEKYANKNAKVPMRRYSAIKCILSDLVKAKYGVKELPDPGLRALATRSTTHQTRKPIPESVAKTGHLKMRLSLDH